MQIGISLFIYSIIPISLVAYYLTIKKNIIGLYIYMGINILLSIYNYNIGSWVQMLLMIMYTILSLYGIHKWGINETR